MRLSNNDVHLCGYLNSPFSIGVKIRENKYLFPPNYSSFWGWCWAFELRALHLLSRHSIT
jgi:hypothetical protein